MQKKFDLVPESIREVKQWVMWGFKSAKGGKLTKVPCDIAGERANPLKSRTIILLVKLCIC